MSSVAPNGDMCKPLKRSLHSLMESSNTKKKDSIESDLRTLVLGIYERHRDDIIEKDFSFMRNKMFVYEDLDISEMYLNVLDTSDALAITKSANMMLELFYHVATDADKDMIK
jgi:hypothetical protein